ncbi:MAG: hypothetical protein IIA77_00955 [Proteobacteria bacterium]|nr:hypothetical protein [Pseudomonadota bacterium]
MTLVERLNIENQLLQIDGLNQFQVYQSNAGDSFFLLGTHNTNVGKSYIIWSPIPNRYPHTRPPVYVRDPNPLPSYQVGVSINSYDTYHSTHTLSNGPNGEVQICHWRDERWHSAITLNKVMLKVVIWLEAYEQHLSTGQAISEFVRTMQ